MFCSKGQSGNKNAGAFSIWLQLAYSHHPNLEGMCDILIIFDHWLPASFLIDLMPRGSHLRWQQLIIAAAYVVNVIGIAANLYASPIYWKQAYHTSKLTGEEWLKELINGHYDRMWTELGMHVHVFLAFVHELRVVCGLEDTRYVGLNEQVAIFQNIDSLNM